MQRNNKTIEVGRYIVATGISHFLKPEMVVFQKIVGNWVRERLNDDPEFEYIHIFSEWTNGAYILNAETFRRSGPIKSADAEGNSFFNTLGELLNHENLKYE